MQCGKKTSEFSTRDCLRSEKRQGILRLMKIISVYPVFCRQEEGAYEDTHTSK